MNDLSWLIYWADAAPQIAEFVCYVGFLVFIFSMFIVFLGFTGFFGDESKYSPEAEWKNDNCRYAYELGPRFRKVWPIPVLAFLMWGGSFLVPSKDTFYLIAASEAGEKALVTPEAIKIRAVINKWLDKAADIDEPETQEEEK